MSEPDLLQQALDHHRNGNGNEAAGLYQQILRDNPERADALYLFGILTHQTGRHQEAVELLKRALTAGAGQAQCYNVLGLALTSLERFEEAGDCFERGLSVQPTDGLYNNIGILRKKQGRLDDAVAAFQKAVTLNPSFTGAHYNLGNAFRALNDLTQAAAALQRAVELDSGQANALAALGQVLHAMNRSREAIPFLQRAVSLLPNDTELTGELARAWYSAGCAELNRGEYIAAIKFFREALAMEPGWCEAQHNLGHALFELGSSDEALALFRQAAKGSQPDLPQQMIATIIPGCPSADHAQVLEARRVLGSLVPAPEPVALRQSGGRLRVGYVSSFFHRVNWMKPVWGLINHHDRAKLEVHLFSDAPLNGAVDSGYRPHSDDRFHNISGVANQEVAAQIEAAEIDLLIDLNGYSKVARLPLLMAHPAPVVVGWFNMFATTGMNCYDYLIGDEQVITPDEEKYYCEKIIRVPGSYLTFEVAYSVPEVVSPPCLEKGSITFGCLAPQYKITGHVISAWSAILQQVPAANLVLRSTALKSPDTQRIVEGLFQTHGISSERLRLYPPADHDEFLKTYAEIDIALDTFPYNGGTTTTEAIWQGVPVVTFCGDRWVSRTSASILRAANLGRFVGQCVEDYIEQAVALANEPDTPEYLADLRSNMRSQLLQSPACDTGSFARNMEEIYFGLCG